MTRNVKYWVVCLTAAVVGASIGISLAYGYSVRADETLHKRWGWAPGKFTVVSRSGPLTSGTLDVGGTPGSNYRYDKLQYVRHGQPTFYVNRLEDAAIPAGYSHKFWDDEAGNIATESPFHSHKDLIVGVVAAGGLGGVLAGLLGYSLMLTAFLFIDTSRTFIRLGREAATAVRQRRKPPASTAN